MKQLFGISLLQREKNFVWKGSQAKFASGKSRSGSTDAFVGSYGFVVSAEITEVVNNTIYAYTLIGWPDDTNVANQICGLRVAYYAPTTAALFLPTLIRQ